MDEAFAGLTGYRRIVDDIVIYDSDEAQHTDHVRQFLRRCSERKITLNTEKWLFAKTEVNFAGFHLSAAGYRVDDAITEAISKFPITTSHSDLRSFVGLVNQLSSSTPTVDSLLAPLRPLLSTKNDFMWSPSLTVAFDDVKRCLTSAPTLSFFDPSRPTRLCTDASRRGLGFVLQQQSDDTWVMIQAGSQFLSDAESRYAIIELELLAVAWAIMKCRLFLAGLPHFRVITNHHPLVPILNTHRLDEIENPRLQRIRTKIMTYNFTTEWVKGPSTLYPMLSPCVILGHWRCSQNGSQMTNPGSPSRRYEPFTLVIRRASAYRPSESMLRRIESISCSCITYGRASLSIGVSYQMAVGSFGVCVTSCPLMMG